MNEIWKDIIGYEGLYQVSNLGRVKSLDRFVTHNYGGLKKVPERILRSYTDKRKYKGVTVRLCKSNKCITYIVSRLVAIHFIENPNSYDKVLHKNDDPTNNTVENLYWGTAAMNTQDMIKKGRAKFNFNYCVNCKAKLH